MVEVSNAGTCPKCGGSVEPESLICSHCQIEIQPLVICDTAILNAGAEKLELDYGATPREHIDKILYEMDEWELVEMAVESTLTPFKNLFTELGIDPHNCWIAVNIPTNKLLDNHLQEKLRLKLGGESSQKIAGDIDLIVGNILGGEISFEYLLAFQIKKRGMDAADSLDRFSSGFGTGQASFTALMGFDKTVLLHFFVRDPKPVTGGYAPSWNPIINASFGRIMRASYGSIKARLQRELYGYGWLGWGQAFGREPDECSGISSGVITQPPFRPRMDDADVCSSREMLTKALIELLSKELRRDGINSLPFIFKWPRKGIH